MSQPAPNLTPPAAFREQLQALVDKFHAHRAEYLKASYNESQARIDFIDPLFEALGWDVRNTAGLGPIEREVLVESGPTAGRPDYNFRVEGRTQFFVEAKAPHVPLDRTDVIVQAKKYAWNTEDVAFAAATDFEEFRFYDASLKPDPRHPDVGLAFAYRYADYLTEKALADLWLLSRQAVRAGSLDALRGRTAKARRLRIPVDQSFLNDLTEWRAQLAKAAFKANPGLDVADLNSAVQVFLDRLIFIRVAEDRGVLVAHQLRESVEAWEHGGRRRSLTSDLNALFRAVNDRLNGEIFRPHHCEKLEWDERLIAEIVHHLYPPLSPYLFNYIGVELLGTIYERYLGKTLRATAKRVFVEDKPEVRKAGGVYYTPKYIVDYIVAQTVGRLVAGKSPAQIAKLNILDPACGSGSFLLGAYQHLLDYHTRWYAEHEGKRMSGGALQAALFTDAETGEARLTLKQKADILRNNLYGVDLDPQAVEITMMSLYLKLLEGERGAIAGSGVLPRLSDNIKCGNSLIAPTLLADDLAHLRPFAWDSEREGFGAILKAGGFDAVIGNPPYIRIQTLQETDPAQVAYFKEHYRSAGAGNYDIYVVFVEKGLSLLNEKGRLGFILPHKFFNSKYGEPLRALIGQGRHLGHVVHFGDQQVFEGATTYTSLLFLDRAGNDSFEFVRVRDLDAWRAGQAQESGAVDAASVTSGEWNFVVGEGAALFEKLRKMPVNLGDVAHIFVGLQTSADTVYLFKDLPHISSKTIQAYSKALDREVILESKLLKPVVRSGEIGRYWAIPTAHVLFPYHLEAGQATLISEEKLKRAYPKTWDYLCQNRQLLANREHGKFKTTGWYQLYPKNLEFWEQDKILIPYMVTDLAAYPDRSRTYFVNVTTGGFGITIDSEYGALWYFAGLLNSRLLDWFLKQVSTTFHGGYFAANKQFLVQLPIRRINFSDPADKARHDRMVALVEHMLSLHQRKAAAGSESAKAQLEREINVTDEQIDALVYELYGLTEAEIAVVEGR